MSIAADSPRVDLHLHTTASDGTLSPEALLARVQAAGLALMAITDHDTLAGFNRLRAQGLPTDVRLLSGIEWSARWRRGDVHIVGLALDADCPQLQARVATQQALRPERAARMADKLARCGLPDTLAGAMALAAGGSVGRLHFARHLVARGAVASEDEAFRRYLGDGGRAHVGCDWPLLAAVIEWTQQAAGVAVLAHPLKYRLSRSRLAELLGEFAAAGGDAVEWPAALDRDTARWLHRLLKAQGLGVSVGSDFHGPDARWNRPGKVASPPDDLAVVWQRWL